jgi:hypothetical protein
MTRVGHSALALANSVGAVSGIENAETGSVSFALAEMARGISPRKTWGYLVSLIRVNERVAKHRLAGTRRFTDEDIALLLRSERGIDYLVAIMGDAEPDWWRRFKAHVAVTNAARVQRAARRQLEEAVDAGAELAATIARAEAALSFQDEDFRRPHVDAQRSVARTQNRAVAQATKRR